MVNETTTTQDSEVQADTIDVKSFYLGGFLITAVEAGVVEAGALGTLEVDTVEAQKLIIGGKEFPINIWTEETEKIIANLVEERNITQTLLAAERIKSAALVAERDTNLVTYTATLAEKDGDIATLNESITEKDAANTALVAERDANLVTYTATLAEKDGEIATLNDSITEKDAANTALELHFLIYTAALTAKAGEIATLNDSITEKDAANTALVAERDANLMTYTATLAEKDGEIATLNGSITEKDAANTALVAERDANLVTYTAALTAKAGEIATLNDSITEKDAANTALVAERDARFVDTDGDGLTDVKEGELETDSTTETTFYLQAAYDSAVAASNSEGRQAGRADVTGNPANFNLTTVEAYNTVVAERDARPTQAAYDAVVAERDARFVDTDEDGLTDVKEGELETDPVVGTTFYLQGTYDNAVAEARTAGRRDVTSNPHNYDLAAPVSADSTVTTPEDISLNITLTGTPSDNGTLTYTVGSATSGTVTVSDSTATYTPNTNFNGEDKFIYTVTEGSLSSTSTITVIVTPVNDEPTGDITISGNILTLEKLTANIDNLADNDGLGTLSYQWSSAEGTDAAVFTDIDGETNSTYITKQQDDGHIISVTVDYTDGAGNQESVRSVPTSVVQL
jgi:hypothetical protein